MGGGGVGCGPPNPLWIHASSVGLGMLISIGTYRTCNFSVAILLIIEQNKLYKKNPIRTYNWATFGPPTNRHPQVTFVGGSIVARDGMLAGSSCLKIANALFIQYRRWTQDVPGIFQYYVFFHYNVSVYAINSRNGV